MSSNHTNSESQTWVAILFFFYVFRNNNMGGWSYLYIFFPTLLVYGSGKAQNQMPKERIDYKHFSSFISLYSHWALLCLHWDFILSTLECDVKHSSDGYFSISFGKEFVFFQNVSDRTIKRKEFTWNSSIFLESFGVDECQHCCFLYKGKKLEAISKGILVEFCWNNMSSLIPLIHYDQ